MKIIVGLGNPGQEYEKTRHNVGFMFLDEFSKCREIAPTSGELKFNTDKKFETEIAETIASGEKIILVKPQTYMNSSGRAVARILAFYKAELKDLIVISDDIDLPLGLIRFRHDGSSGGHKGLGSIIDTIKSEKFLHIRVGINGTGEKMTQGRTTSYVLERFEKREEGIVDSIIPEGVSYLAKHLFDRGEIPAHTMRILPKEDSIEK